MDANDLSHNARALHYQNLRLQTESQPLIEDKVFQSLEEYVLHLIHIKAYEEAANLVNGKKVLDWGCNIGYGMEVLLSSASSVAGLDVSPDAVAVAQQRIGNAAIDIQLYDGTHCNYESESFDAVTSFQVIEHVSDYTQYFSEITRVLQPGGLAIFTTPNAALRLNPGMKPWNRFHVREFLPSELRELLIPWFATVEMRGLFGSNDLYAIERNRVERAKEAAAASHKHEKLRWTALNIAKACTPQILRDLIRNRVYSRQSVKRSVNLDASQLKCFSTNDLFYRVQQIDNALDLMVVCRKNH